MSISKPSKQSRRQNPYNYRQMPYGYSNGYENNVSNQNYRRNQHNSHSQYRQYHHQQRRGSHNNNHNHRNHHRSNSQRNIVPGLQSHQNESYYQQMQQQQYQQYQHQKYANPHQYGRNPQSQNQRQHSQSHHNHHHQQYQPQQYQHHQREQQQQHIPNKQIKSKNRSNRSRKNKEKPLLKESCSLPEDDEVLRASVLLLKEESNCADGYSSDNALLYGKISITSKYKTANPKTKYLQQLGKEILTNNPKFRNIDQKDELANHDNKNEGKTLYNVITKRLNEQENEHEVLSDNSHEIIRRAERNRREVIHARFV